MLDKHNSAWKKYFNERSKKIALGNHIADPLDYGREAYSSAKIFRKDRNGFYFLRWVVCEFEGEYNVFFEKTELNGKTSKTLAASYNIKDSAIKFALEMLLITNGKINRHNDIVVEAS